MLNQPREKFTSIDDVRKRCTARLRSVFLTKTGSKDAPNSFFGSSMAVVNAEAGTREQHADARQGWWCTPVVPRLRISKLEVSGESHSSHTVVSAGIADENVSLREHQLGLKPLSAAATRPGKGCARLAQTVNCTVSPAEACLHRLRLPRTAR